MPTVKFSRLAAVASAAVILAIGVAPLGIWAADHLDSPTVSASGATDLLKSTARCTTVCTRAIFLFRTIMSAHTPSSSTFSASSS